MFGLRCVCVCVCETVWVVVQKDFASELQDAGDKVFLKCSEIGAASVRAC